MVFLVRFREQYVLFDGSCSLIYCVSRRIIWVFLHLFMVMVCLDRILRVW